MTWPKKEIEATDIKTKMFLTVHGGFHPKSSTLRLYTERKEGGRGQVSGKATIKQKPNDDEEEDNEEEPSWKEKPLHGMYNLQKDVADFKRSVWQTAQRH